MFNLRRHHAFIALFLMASLFLGTAAEAQRYTKRDRMWKGAGIGAAVGAAGALVKGKREADEILAGAAIGGVVGGAIGAYMDRQQERLAHIPGTTVERMGEDTLLVHFDSDVLFNSGSATLDADGRSTLEQVADVINDYRKTAVVVQGHTDAVGSEESNQYLSERRARSVENYLTNRGVDPDRMTAIGFGESAPVASNASSYGRQKNRRVDVLLKAKSGPLRQGY
ncbi:MAG TPA: OmpA family protein [Thermoanaerobaculia bacterium]|jgi:outer membrane protein OmpA-like peptidoglycan-associated protein